MKNLFIGLMLIASSQVGANTLPTKIQAYAFPAAQFEATPKQKEEIYTNLSTAINSVANGSILLPESLNLYTVKSYGNAFYLGLAEGIATPYQLIIEGASKHPKFTRGVELHEFAHSIFEVNLPVILRNNKKDLKIANSYLKSKKHYKNEAVVMLGYMVAADLTAGTADESTFAELYSISESNFEAAASSKETVLNNYIAFSETLTPLNEFFADVFAVAITKDPEVIKKAIQYTAHAGVDQSNRSFSIRPGKRVYNFSPHDFYSLSRYYIYKYYLSEPEIRKKGVSWIMTKTLESVRCAVDSNEALEKDIQAKLETFSGNEERYILERFNLNFNHCIDVEFQK